jgi:uncharacterized protein (TIGR02145 family)
VANDGSGIYGTLVITISGQTSEVPNTGWLSYWKCDEASGSTLYDSIGSNDLTVSGATTGVTGKVGKAIEFTNNTDYAVKTSASISLTDTVSVLLGFKLNTAPATGLIYNLLNIVDTNDWTGVLAVRIYPGLYIAFALNDTSNNTYTAVSVPMSVPVGSWVEVLSVLNGTELKIYINGVDATDWSDTFAGVLNSGNFICVGNQDTSEDKAPDGMMDEIGISDTALTLTDAVRLYNSGNWLSSPFGTSVTAITVTGAGSDTTIATKSGTLQLSAHLDPHDASNTSVVWSVIAGTGLGNIGDTGLLTAVSDGTVTVRATATDGSGIYGELEITISNQTITYKNIAPTGWHVPDQTEINTLITYLGGDTVAGGKLKEAGTTHWLNALGTNESGFNGIGGGVRNYADGVFYLIQYYANYWLVTETPANPGIYEYLPLVSDTNETWLGQNTGGDPRNGHSIRCLMDDPSGWQEGDTVTDIDGNEYATCQIGTQVWMVANLRVTRFNDGTPIPEVTDNTEWANLTTAGRCTYNNEW